MKGRVKWWSIEKGYGFIEYNNNQNVFVHLKEKDKSKNEIKENTDIEFTIDDNNYIKFFTLKKSQ